MSKSTIKSQSKETEAATVAHDEAWRDHFITPIARSMKSHGVRYLLILILDDGKAQFVLDPDLPKAGMKFNIGEVGE